MKPWRVQARDDHFAILGANGDEMLVSVKDYASAASAKRAAENALEALTTREVVFETLDADGNPVVESTVQAAKPASAGKGEKINPPEPGVSAHAVSPHAQ